MINSSYANQQSLVVSLGVIKFLHLRWSRRPTYMLSTKSKNFTLGQCLSSASKILAAINSEKYFVYDSRVSIALNFLWEGYLGEKSPFPLLPTRKTKFNEVVRTNMKTMMTYQKDNQIREQFNSEIDYCQNLIIPLAKMIGVESNPQEVEMVLFTFVDEIISHFKVEPND